MVHKLSRSLFSRSGEASVAQVGLNRRGFLGYAAGSAVVLGAAACVGTEEDEPVGGYGGGKGDDLDFEDGVCVSGPTGDDALGPYWTPNTRQTIQLARPEEAGQRLVIMGHVYASDCITPVTGATMVAWQADDEGLYDYNHAGLNQGSSQGQLSEAQTNLRGRFSSSVSGTYAIETIFPSEYPLNLLDPANSAFRAPHIHFAVFYADTAGVQHQLVTQMYFQPNDLVRGRVPDIDGLNAQDFGASTADPTRLITLDGGDRDLWHGQFDIVLPVDPGNVSP